MSLPSARECLHAPREIAGVTAFQCGKTRYRGRVRRQLRNRRNAVADFAEGFDFQIHVSDRIALIGIKSCRDCKQVRLEVTDMLETFVQGCQKLHGPGVRWQWIVEADRKSTR